MNQMIGRVLEGYRIEAELGRGGQAVVYRATQLALQRQVALKVVTPNLSADPTFMERFTREGISAAGLDHPHVIPVYEAGEAEGLAFLAMKFVDGPSLDGLIHGGAGISPQRAVGILRQVASALDFANDAGLVHRDIKPANILVGPGDHAYLSDFGLTRAAEGSRLTGSGVWMGTLEYVAPEQIKGEAVTAASDRYGLAVVAYECITGRAVFDQTDHTALLYAHLNERPVAPSRRRPDLGPGVDAVFARGLHKDPAERFPTAATLIQAVESALITSAAWTRAPEPGRPRPVSAPPPPTGAPVTTVPPPPTGPPRAEAPPPPPAPAPAAARTGIDPRLMRWALLAGAVVAAILVVLLVMNAAGVFDPGTRTVVVLTP